MNKLPYLLVMGLLFPFLSYSQNKMVKNNEIISIVKTEIRHQFSKDELDALEVQISDSHKSKQSNIGHYYFRQVKNDLEISGTESSIHLSPDGTVLQFNNQLTKEAVAQSNDFTSPSLSTIQAISKAANHLGYKSIGKLEVLEGHRSFIQNISKGNISRRDIPIKLVYHLAPSREPVLAWDFSIYETQNEDWWSIRMDAQTGKILEKINWISHCNIADSKHECTASNATKSTWTEGLCKHNVEEKNTNVAGYKVYPIPFEHPDDGGRILVNSPHDSLASPFGWHDTNGSPGPEYTTTQGNNVHAFDYGNNVGYSPDAGSQLQFDFPLDLSQSPENFEDAGLSNLFYTSNIAHDIFYQYGFDEASGNFQENNYGNGGSNSDYVLARSQKATSCGATFGTPADGFKPSMTLNICNGRDAALSNGIILHEYGHGLSNRLTGGPSQANCLYNDENMGEGWSDFLGLVITLKATDLGTNATPMASWFSNNSQGIRPFPYSTNMNTNPHTYANSFSGTSIPHGLGSVWCIMLWEMTWNLIDQYGFDPDVYNGSGGNNMALQLVIEGMKLQPCRPGFVDGRDAILAADQALYGGANHCLIWEAFAKRGLGKNASQGSSLDRTDGYEAFNLPISCGGTDCELLILNVPNPQFDYLAHPNQTIDIESSGNWTASTNSSWINISTPSGSGNGQVTYSLATNPGYDSRSDTIEISCGIYTLHYIIHQDYGPCTQSYGSFPYTTNFETSSFDGNWCLESSEDCGSISLTGQHAPRDNFHLVMDKKSTGASNTNTAELGINLSNTNGVGLTFWWKKIGNSTLDNGGVYISNSGGLFYVKIFDFDGSAPNYQEVTLNISQIATDIGFTPNATFIIKFQQTDDPNTSTDGITIDDINLFEIVCNVGASCDDNDPCTENDVFQSTCGCEGTYNDSDNDGVCDFYDICPGGNENEDFDVDSIPDFCDPYIGCNDCTTIVSTFPSTEDFENGEGNTCQYQGDDFDWDIGNGPTPSPGTGPSAAYQGVNYFYIESGYPNSLKSATFQGACYDFSTAGSASIEFWYHMFGTDVSELALNVTSDGKNWTRVWYKQGNMGNQWHKASIDVSAYVGNTFSYRFSAFSLNHPFGDISLDAITVDVELCTPGNSCNDGDPCTSGDVFISGCNCIGTFQDSDNDTVCDFYDACPGVNDSIPLKTTEFLDNPLTHTGGGTTTTTLSFATPIVNPEFTISGLDYSYNSIQSLRYVDRALVVYTDSAGTMVLHGLYAGTNFSSATVRIPGAIQEIEILFSDSYDGDTDANMSISLSPISYCSACIDADVSVWMEGVYDPVEGEMTTELNTQFGLLPGQTPVSSGTPTPAGQPYHVSPWNYTGTEGNDWIDFDYTSDMVDWMLVSFRTAPEKSSEINRTAGVLNKNGSIYFLGCPLDDPGIDSVYVVVEHRSHLGIMSPTPFPIEDNAFAYDFRTGNSYKVGPGSGQKLLPTGEWCMFAGDMDQSDAPGFDINGIDNVIWGVENGTFLSYLKADINMDGDVNGLDKILWTNNNGIFGTFQK